MDKNEIFIEKAKRIHGDKYDYSKVEYVNCSTKVCIVCSKHGEFWQTPNKHLCGCGCPKCAGKGKNKEYFLEKAKEIHGDKYDYSKVEYVNWNTKVCIICPNHGEFWQSPEKHISQKHQCPKCSNRVKLTNDEFIDRAKQVHGDKYNYSKVKYINCDTKVCIICPKHGEFFQSPSLHLFGCNCPKCTGGVKITKDDFIRKSKEVHGDKYDYSKVKYINARTKVCIICPEHGEFWIRPDHHMKGSGCARCMQSKSEYEIEKILIDNNIEYETQKEFSWLVNDRKMKLDFYLPKYSLAIECQGIQHFEPVDFANKGKKWAEELFIKNQLRDKIKKELCNENGVEVIYFSLFENDKTISETNALLNEIKKYDTTIKQM